MSRSTIKNLGLILLVPFGLMALVPVLAKFTDLLNNTAAFSLQLGTLTLVSLSHTATGVAVGTAWTGAWVLAGLGELLLISVHVAAPVRKSRHVVGFR